MFSSVRSSFSILAAILKISPCDKKCELTGTKTDFAGKQCVQSVGQSRKKKQLFQLTEHKFSLINNIENSPKGFVMARSQTH